MNNDITTKEIRTMKKLFLLLGTHALCAVSALAAPLGTAFTYQGRLNDGGAPASGLYDLTFTLHDHPTDAQPYGGYIILSAVPVTNGLFNVQLNAGGEFGANAFDGSARWLQIGVRTNNDSIFNNFTMLSPRQPITPTPAALFASNAVQAATAISANSATTAQTANVAGSVAWGNVTGIPSAFADGIDNDSTYSAGPGLSLSGANEFSVKYDGSGSAASSARSDHHHFGANFSGNSSGYGLVVANNSTTGSGLYSRQGSGSGASVPFDYKAATWAESSHGDAVYGASGSPSGTGVYGYAASSTGANYGVYGQSDSTNGVGVLARGSGVNGTALRISNGAIRVSGAGPGSPTPAFVHVVTAANLKLSIFNLKGSVIDNPYCNNDPNAVLILTPNYRDNPLQACAAPAVFYDTVGLFAKDRWVVMASEKVAGQEILEGGAFNVLVIKP